MILSEVTVRGLFGRFDHEIALKKNERVTIMIAPNGFGKTMILRIINSLFNQQLRQLAAMPFQEVSAGFDNGQRLTVTRTQPTESSSRKTKSILTVTLHKSARARKAFVLPRVSSDDISYPLGLIDEWVPALDRMAPKLWRNRETDETLDLDDVIERYGHEFPDDVRPDRGTPDWLREVQSAVSVRFVDVERLSIPRREHGFRRTHRRPRPAKRAINMYSNELGNRIQQTLAEYGLLSQSLDRTFPTRLVKQPHRSDITMTELRDELAEIEGKRRKLVEAGLLQQEHAGLSAPALDVEEIEESRREALAMFAQDTRQKLGVFDDILAKVETLKRIANSRLLHKSVAVNEDGIVVTTPDGQPLDLEKLSSGEQHELVLLYGLLFRVSPGALILIDEPELSLHVAWQEEFLSDIDDIATLSGCRALLATHSPQIIGDRYDLAIELEGPS